MLYLYIDLSGDVGKSEDAPNASDRAAITDGQLTVVRITADGANIWAEEMDPCIGDDADQWSDVIDAETYTDDDGNEYHFVI